ncbi:MAG: hypothetical protein HYY64_06440 [Candidatus Rokubacteria bacterium]|nr:hypothetical protein [Candidatus Rokubacteria bacterium]
MRFARRLWAGWKRVAERLGVFQSRLLLVLLYFVVVAPFALLVKIAKEPLRMRRIDGSNWVPHPGSPADLERARRQF